MQCDLLHIFLSRLDKSIYLNPKTVYQNLNQTNGLVYYFGCLLSWVPCWNQRMKRSKKLIIDSQTQTEIIRSGSISSFNLNAFQIYAWYTPLNTAYKMKQREILCVSGRKMDNPAWQSEAKSHQHWTRSCFSLNR